MGIDLLSCDAKICTFDCIYCQLGKTLTYTNERKLYVPIEAVIKELEILPEIKIDHITFSGRGEPTLAANLGEAIKAVKLIRKEPIAVLTNSTLMDREDVRKELILADFVIAKLDACSQESLKKINNPVPAIEFGDIVDGIKQFRKEYNGKLALQVMFIEENKDKFAQLAYLVNYIKPDEVQINTPLRPCNIKPLPKEEILKIKEIFTSACKPTPCAQGVGKGEFRHKEINVISVYDERVLKDVLPVSDEDTLKRRGKV